MKRQSVLLILAACLITGLTACGKKASGSAEQEKQTASQEQQSGDQTTASLSESGTENTKEFGKHPEKETEEIKMQNEQTVRRHRPGTKKTHPAITLIRLIFALT